MKTSDLPRGFESALCTGKAQKIRKSIASLAFRSFKKELQKHRDFLLGWISKTGDQGQDVESDIGLLATMKRWGNLCVNPEYDRVRERYKAWKKSQIKK